MASVARSASSTASHPDIHAHRILILDFGAQYTQLIARRGLGAADAGHDGTNHGHGQRAQPGESGHAGFGRIFSQKDADRAIADLEAAVAKKPSPQGYYSLGEALKAKGLNDKAAAAYKKALELQPNYPEASKALAAIKK